MAKEENVSAGEFFKNLAKLCVAAAEGDGAAGLALELLEKQQLAVNKGLITQIEVDHFKLVSKASTSLGPNRQNH